MVECLTWDPLVTRSSLTGVTALCPWARHINPCLVLVQPRHNWKTVELDIIKSNILLEALLLLGQGMQTGKAGTNHWTTVCTQQYVIAQPTYYGSFEWPGPQIRERNRKLFFLFLNQNICCGYSKELSRWDCSFEHPKHMFKLMGKKIFTILRWKIVFI